MTITSSRPTLLVGNGWVDKQILRHFSDFSEIIALDGGANTLQKYQIMPDIIIGDLDSVENLHTWEESGVCIQHCADQDSTDLDKALRQLDAPFVIALGILGDRLDHGLASLACMARYPVGSRMVVIGREDIVRYVTTDTLTLHIPKQHRISLWTMQPVDFVRSEGLAYPLDHLTLSPQGVMGTSNHASQDTQVIEKYSLSAGYYVLLEIRDIQHILDLA